MGSPASAQSADDEKEIWSATITVGMEGSGRGFYDQGVPEDYGSISDDDFSARSNDYDIDIIADNLGFNGVLVFAVSPQLDPTSELVLTLHVGGRTFDFNDATLVQDANLYAYQWRNLGSRIDWAENDEVVVKITEGKSISVTGGSAWSASGATSPGTVARERGFSHGSSPPGRILLSSRRRSRSALPEVGRHTGSSAPASTASRSRARIAGAEVRASTLRECLSLTSSAMRTSTVPGIGQSRSPQSRREKPDLSAVSPCRTMPTVRNRATATLLASLLPVAPQYSR